MFLYLGKLLHRRSAYVPCNVVGTLGMVIALKQVKDLCSKCTSLPDVSVLWYSGFRVLQSRPQFLH